MTEADTATVALMVMLGDIYGDTLTYRQLYTECHECILDAYDKLRAKYQAIEEAKSHE